MKKWTPAILAGIVIAAALAVHVRPAMTATPVILKVKGKPALVNWVIDLQWTQGGNPLGPVIPVNPDPKGIFATNKPPGADDVEVWAQLIGVPGLALACHFDINFPVTQVGKGLKGKCQNQSAINGSKAQFGVQLKAG
jgi:hypothetical protein